VANTPGIGIDLFKTRFFNRPRVHVMRNVLAHAGKSGRRVVSAFIATAFAQETPEAARHPVASRRRSDPAEGAQARFHPRRRRAGRARLHDLPEGTSGEAALDQSHRRLNGEIKRRTDVVGIFPNDDAIFRLVGALLLEQNDEWAVQRARYKTLESVGQLSDDPLIRLPAVAR